jgi:hypothetical protein
MFDSERERELAETFAPKHAPRPEHKAALEAELVARFDTQSNDTKRKPMKKNVTRKVFFGAALAAAIGVAACAAPVDVDVDVGKSLTVAYTAGGAMPDPRAVVEAVKGAGTFDDVNIRVRRQNDEVVVQMEVWGQNAGDVNLGDTLKKALPALASAKITEQALSGKVESTLGQKLGHELFDMNVANEKDVEVIRQKILEDLAAQGVEGEVKVHVENEDGKQKVRIEVRQEGADCEPGTEIEKKTAP